jgi:hypothetical protein
LLQNFVLFSIKNKWKYDNEFYISLIEHMAIIKGKMSEKRNYDKVDILHYVAIVH